MDSNKPVTKRGIEVISLEDDQLSSSSGDGRNGAKTKRLKQELHPLQMGSVLEQIFSHLGPKSIKNARQVNPLWSVEGAKMLITKCHVKIPGGINDGNFITRVKALDKFKAFLSLKSSSFSTIPKIAVNAVADVEVWEYLGVLEHVKFLKIRIIPGENGDGFLKNLLDLLPNLEYLRFEGLDYEPKIIRALTSAMSAPEKDLKSLSISLLCLYPRDMEELEDMEKFAACKNIKIKKLQIEMDPGFLDGVQALLDRVSKVMSNVLSTSQNILTTLELTDCHPILPLLEFPCMPALTQIDLLFENEIEELSNCKLSPSFRFSENVPNLQEMIINEKKSDTPPVAGQISRHCFTNLFESAGTAPSVKRVQCWGNVSDFDVYHLFKTFPNITHFSADLMWHSDVMLRSLWNHGQCLKELRLDVDLYSPLEKIDDLDASFTGLPVWTVDEIKKAPNMDPYTLEELGKLRINSSILSLKELKYFTINFRGHWEKDMPNRMLAVAGEHAFKLLPKNPNIVINIEEFEGSMDLSEISKLPNVKIVP